ncbi:MAG: hypothetical protein KJ556_06485 [Gammaproteobacteria bacterium]|nr:hypothetical protein [Gammaproteobacteria bacterium]MBU2058994.1 hypothetical protein [Gammaproteobacteria bacterium]MBU2174757.1 hypothetical protein [Gammaproteobacteria bacterium]MBU2245796.1 hypothetical protein [Gammaproteobacteria bacterium]MBU2343576.1 hypothetical protein [Gammaproteobacteria bacterium]
MWLKSGVALLVGLVINTSLMLNLTLLLPLPIDVLLLLGFVLGFIVWAAVMTWFYCQPSLRQALRPCVPVLLLSVTGNVLLILGGSQ